MAISCDKQDVDQARNHWLKSYLYSTYMKYPKELKFKNQTKIDQLNQWKLSHIKLSYAK